MILPGLQKGGLVMANSLEWLMNYGVQKHTFDFEDIDVTDKLMLQDQINKSRKEWHTLLMLLDDIQGKIIEINKRMATIVKDETQRAQSEGSRVNLLLSTNDEYVTLEAEQKALSAGVSLINGQMEFCKNDLRVLNSVFYNKF